ncbi:carboxypeptidase regulatory-like domain-containing protein [Blastopirellula marina]|uniref:Carboxypeptidase regulatory-like domain-containing protein n=1 Tax=Blastopirellula marina TaxID=124 RepID=A0A2S8FXA7_9BACT|nr:MULTISPECIES: carboxypeptidase regulatory-like domain-containing protein [Pirellulaceae]PQO36799.1 carboxypeptidase regulatory-like domain-containing protein [Blastopirellula marina]RCS53514.1 carboxypeptidase regulatory-like domain-containing protein [Bremerella cremea]
MSKTINRSQAAFAFSLLLATVGCMGGSSEHGHVTGTLTINGSPVQDAVVTFAPAEGGRSAIAVTQSDGTYELNYTPGVKGAKVGVNNVRITTYVAPELDDNKRVVNPGVAERLPPKYSRGQEISVEVKPGDNTFDFAVEADKDKYPPPPQ